MNTPPISPTSAVRKPIRKEVIDIRKVVYWRMSALKREMRIVRGYIEGHKNSDGE